MIAGMIVLAAVSHRPVSQQSPYARRFAEAKAAVTDSLKDPLAAKFRGFYPFTDGDGVKKICGEVLGKNSYGAYTGYQHFAYLIDSRTVIFAPSPDDDDANALNKAGSGCGFGSWHY